MFCVTTPNHLLQLVTFVCLILILYDITMLCTLGLQFGTGIGLGTGIGGLGKTDALKGIGQQPTSLGLGLGEVVSCVCVK